MQFAGRCRSSTSGLCRETVVNFYFRATSLSPCYVRSRHRRLDRPLSRAEKDLPVDESKPGSDALTVPLIDQTTIEPEAPPTDVRVLAVVAVARHHGVELRPADFRFSADEEVPSPARLVSWARDAGLYAKADRVRWKSLFKLQGTGNPVPPLVLLFKDGTAAMMVGSDQARGVVWLRDPRTASTEDPVPVDELRLSEVWGGEVLLIRTLRATAVSDKPFTLGWLLNLVLVEKRSLRDISIASITLSALTIMPPLLVMSVVDRVVQHRSVSTLVLLATILGITTLYETLIGYARREIVQVVSTRVDAKLNVHIFDRLLGLPRLLRAQPSRANQLPPGAGLEGA